MDEFDNQDYVAFSINYEKMLKEPHVLSVTKMLGSQLMANPYLVVGEFIANLSDGDLQALMRSADDTYANQFEDLCLVGEMLATGEGCPQSATTSGVLERAKQLLVLLTMESLYRKGLVKVNHENITFADDGGDKIVAERIEGIDYQSIIAKGKKE